MNKKNRILFTGMVVIMMSGCAMAPLSEQVFKTKLPVAKNADGEGTALVAFSAEKIYESPKGVPLAGDPLVCGKDGLFRVNDENSRTNQIKVRAGEEIAVTSVIRWENTGWTKTCWPFVAFTPENGAKYIVVNERIGGKGVSAMWTGVARQTCQVSVYQESPTGIQRVPTRTSSANACRSNEQEA
jgi:hypothetical protein